MKASQIRKHFIDYFVEKGHVKWPSSELIPYKDPTLLFVNSGMVQFKDFLTGKIKPKTPRIVTIQKCVRAGGKHNDLEQVGFTARHHTFFEMLGNFSFGDYFKEEAICFAWEFLTKILKIPKEKLFVSAHHEDLEASNIWLKKIKIPSSHFFMRGDQDNFWEMGEIGPCGPCSEIFFDYGPKYESKNPSKALSSPLENENRFVEIWNLVFMQYEKYKENKKIKKRNLPTPCIDTGAGLERLSAVLQNVYNNYETDLFQDIILEIKKYLNQTFTQKKQSNSLKNQSKEKKEKREDTQNRTRFYVLADHIRSSTMLITDGVIPSNEGRGYVLRRIIRRAVRHLNDLRIKEPFLFQLVDAVFKSLGSEYPENKKNKHLALKYLKMEEQSFRQTLSSGLKLLEKEIQMLKQKNKKLLEGKKAFHLYDTHGFPMDITQAILKENGLEMDIKEFEEEMKIQKTRSKKNQNIFSLKEETSDLFRSLKEKIKKTSFRGYEVRKCNAKLLKILDLNEEEIGLIFDETPFYAEAGGQIGDQGWILKEEKILFEVKDTSSPIDGLFVHMVKKNKEGSNETLKLKEGNIYTLKINEKRRSLIAKNHTATHLLHAALRKILGPHIKQSGSAVREHSLRFDFSHPNALTKEEIYKIENLVNQQIFKAHELKASQMTKNQALEKGALALFGEKYGEEVRVIEIEDFSIEFCGGTHVQNTNEIHLFKILSESALAKGIRRIEALTSQSALKEIEKRLLNLEKLEQTLQAKDERALERLEKLKKDLKTKEKDLKNLKEEMQTEKVKSLFKNPLPIKNDMVFKILPIEEGTHLRKISELFINQYKNGLIFIHTTNEKRISILLRTSKENKKIDCNLILKEALSPLEGRSGGKSDLAQGSIEFHQLNQLKKNIENLILN